MLVNNLQRNAVCMLCTMHYTVHSGFCTRYVHSVMYTAKNHSGPTRLCCGTETTWCSYISVTETA